MQRSHLKPLVSEKRKICWGSPVLPLITVTWKHGSDLLIHSPHHIILLSPFPGLTDLQPCIFYCNTEFRISRSIQNCQKAGQSWLYLSKSFFAETVKQAVQWMSRNNASLPPRGNPGIPFLTVLKPVLVLLLKTQLFFIELQGQSRLISSLLSRQWSKSILYGKWVLVNIQSNIQVLLLPTML